MADRYLRRTREQEPPPFPMSAWSSLTLDKEPIEYVRYKHGRGQNRPQLSHPSRRPGRPLSKQPLSRDHIRILRPRSNRPPAAESWAPSIVPSPQDSYSPFIQDRIQRPKHEHSRRKKHRHRSRRHHPKGRKSRKKRTNSQHYIPLCGSIWNWFLQKLCFGYKP